MKTIEELQQIAANRGCEILKCFNVELEKAEHFQHKYLRKENGKYVYEEDKQDIKDKLVKTRDFIKKYNDLIESHLRLESQAPEEYRKKLRELKLKEKEYLESLKNES